jgi:tryptophan synthase alpha chain
VRAAALAGAERVEAAIRAAGDEGRPALAAFLTAGFPSRSAFPDILRRVAEFADVLELGVPFSDPMADGVTIQEASRAALAGGVTLDWIFDLVAGLDLDPPVVLMSYLNPLLTRSLGDLAARATAASVEGFIVPDLPYEESEPMRHALDPVGLALVQLVTPLTPPARRKRLAEVSTGFLYAVTRTGTTGAATRDGDAPGGEQAPGAFPAGFREYAAGLRAVSPRPVLAGFGVRTPEQVRRLHGHFDGVIVGSALIEKLTTGEDPAEFLGRLRNSPPAEAEDS